MQIKVKKEETTTASTSTGEPPNTQPELPVLPTLNLSTDTASSVTEDALTTTVKTGVQQTISKCALTDLFPDTFITKVEPAKPASDRASAEIIQYKAEPLLHLSENPLQWWKDKEDNYPLLSILARYHLCVPATSVPSERVFSKAGQIVSDRRALIKPKHVDYLIFLNKNMK